MNQRNMQKERIFLFIGLLLIFSSCSTEESTEETGFEQGEQELPPLDEEQASGDEPISREVSGGKDEETGEFSPSTNIYYHAAYFMTSEDGESLEFPEPTIEHNSVPEILELTQDIGEFKAGTLVMFFVDSTESLEGVDLEVLSMSYSTDKGETWSERVTIDIEGTDDLLLGPSAVQLEDGRIRLYLFDFSVGKLIPTGQATEFEMYSAISEDGETFTLEQKSFSSDTMVTDPEVIFFDGQWIMYMVSQEESAIIAATSSDGLNFEYLGSTEVLGIPGATVVGDEVYLYGCDTGITLAKSSDGITFSEPELILQQPVCDPSAILLSDGSFALVVRGFSE